MIALCGIFLTFSLNDEIFYIILLVPHNIIMNLNNFMLTLRIKLGDFMCMEITWWKPKEPSYMWNTLGLVHSSIVSLNP